MKCHKCQNSDTSVIESRDVADGNTVRRRRECPKCLCRFTTYERLERPQLVVIKKDGSRELFDRLKILSGLNKACEKTAITGVQIESLVDSLEQEIYSRGEPEVTSKEIGELVMSNLAQLSDVAYVRFASVYRCFTDLTSFEEALANIKAKKGTTSTKAKS